MAESDEIVALARAMYAAWNAQGPPGLAPFLSDDAEWHDAPELPDARVVKGRDAVLELLKVWDTGGGGVRLHLELSEVLAAGDEWVSVGVASVRGDTSGAAVLAPEWCHVARVRDGKVTRLRSFFKRAEALQAAGLDAEHHAPNTVLDPET